MRPSLALAALLPAFAAIAVVGCGGGGSSAVTGTPISTTSPTASSTSPAPPQAASGGRDRILVAALGDSITAGSPIWDPNPQVRGQIGPALDPKSQFEYWATRRDQSLAFRNCGVFGERTDQIAERLDQCAAGADALIIQGGINDIAQGRPVKLAAADIKSMIERGLKLGLPVAVTDVLPWNNGHPQADAPIAELNRDIARIAEAEGVPLLPFHDTLEDPEQPGLMRPDWTIDGDHPSVAGYRLLGEQAFALPR